LPIDTNSLPLSPPFFEEIKSNVKIIDHNKMVEPSSITPQRDIEQKIEAAERAVKFLDNV
jgi:hypothetical protein